MSKYYFLYKTTCLVSNRYYIGMHFTSNLKDGYLGSGIFLRNSIRKHGKENHLREILEFLPSKELLKIKEREIVNEKLLLDPLCMNLKIGGMGGAVFGERNQWYGKPAWNRGKKASIEAKQNMRKPHPNQKSWNKGQKGLYHLSQEHKDNIGKSQKGIPKPHKGHSISEKTKEKMRKPHGPMTEKSIQKMRKPKSEEAKQNMSLSKKGKTSTFKDKKHSEKSKQEMRKNMKGRVPWNKKVKE